MMKLLCAPLCALAVVCISAPTFAALGGDASSVEADRASMKGALRVTPTVDYSLHEIQTSAGVVIHEYVSADGKVFAVSWRGPAIPDLPLARTPRQKFPRAVPAGRREIPCSLIVQSASIRPPKAER